MSEGLRDALLEFDGKALSYLSETSLKFRSDPDYFAALVALAGDRTAHIDSGATWLLKDYLDQGGRLAPDLVQPFLRQLIADPSWGAALHILQSVRRLDLHQVSDSAVFETISAYTAHARPFLRAWAVDAMWRMAQTFAGFETRARHAMDAALNDPAASVRARARQLLKEAG